MSLDGGWGDFKEPKYLRGIVSFGSQNCGTVRTFTMHTLYFNTSKEDNLHRM